jgi:hypothetical protein
MARPRKIIEKVDTDYFENLTAIWTTPWLCDFGRVAEPDGTIKVEGLLSKIAPSLPPNIYQLMLNKDGRSEVYRAIKAALTSIGQPNDITKIWIDDIHPDYHVAAKELAKWKPQINGWGRDGWAKHSDNIFLTVRTELIKTCEAWRGYDWQAFENEYERLKQYWSDGPVWIKEFQWSALPDKLPPQATLIGLCLADVVAQFGNGKAAQKVRHNPVKFDIIDQTPWKAILEFIEVILGQNQQHDNTAIRRSITYHAPNILKFYRTPNNSKY